MWSTGGTCDDEARTEGVITKATQIRAELGHPVIDADGHVLELMPAVLPYLRETLGPRAFERYRAPVDHDLIGAPPPEVRTRTRAPRASWWGSPTWKPRDLAASLAPRLLHERLGEMGIDFAILYPTHGLGSAGIAEEEVRRGVCAGFNEFLAASYGPWSDRLAVAGTVPVDTPEEAIAELEHCHALGIKVIAIPHAVLRPIETPEPTPWLYPGQTHWLDHLGLDSAYDYDPVWERCRQLGFAVTVHGGAGIPPVGWYTSTSSFVANHIGSFLYMNYPICKALLLGGVTRRFPDIPFVFQECGVSWATGLLADTIEHWEKRNVERLRAVNDIDLLDIDELERLVRQWAPELVAATPGPLAAALRAALISAPAPDDLDEWAAMDVRGPRDILQRFVPSFSFGCEADDRNVAAAFAPSNPLGAELSVMLGSDISHFDTPDFDEVLPDAHGLVRDGLLDADQFRRFTCDNAIRCFTRLNPAFFDGTSVEGAVPER